MREYRVDVAGYFIVDAHDDTEAEDIALDLLSGDLAAWADNPNIENELVVTDVKEIND